MLDALVRTLQEIVGDAIMLSLAALIVFRLFQSLRTPRRFDAGGANQRLVVNDDMPISDTPPPVKVQDAHELFDNCGILNNTNPGSPNCLGSNMYFINDR